MIHPTLQKKIDELIKKMKELGYEVAIHQGMRTFAEQNSLYAQGRTKPGKVVTKARAGFSWHNYGLAADVVFKVKGKWSWDDKLPWKKMGEIGKSLGMAWGGDWGWDMPHFEYHPNLTLRQALAIHNMKGLKGVWSVV